MSKPRILFISFSWPRGPIFGGQMRALSTGRALKQLGEVDLLVVSSDQLEEQRARSSEEFELAGSIIPHQNPNRSIFQKLRRALDTSYLNIHGCTATDPDRNRVLKFCEKYDLVWIYHSRVPNILQIDKWDRTHLDIDDIPSTNFRNAAAGSSLVVERAWNNLQQYFFKKRELRYQERFTSLSVSSEADRHYLGLKNLWVIPNGVDRPSREPTRQPATNPPCIGFIGLYSYAPNRAGVEWFLENCWAQIRQKIPGIRFRLIGKDTDGPDKPSGPDIDTLGWVADPAAEIATWSAMVIPILSGGGTRIKIADAFSRKCPVVSTTVGAFGYEVKNGQELLLADTPSDFANACVSLIDNHQRGAALAENAWRKFLDHWTWDAIAPKIWTAAEDCLRRTR